MEPMKESESRFVVTFVNQMYVILLGIGIGNVFLRDFALAEFDKAVAAIFVIIVVVFYWLDWVEGVEHSVSTTKGEFWIDLLILLSLVPLFAYYHEPIILALLFLWLGVVGLLWRINHYWIDAHCTASQLPHKLFQKVYALLVYAVSFIAVRFISIQLSSRLSSTATKLLQLTVIAVAFAVVYRFFFREPTKRTISA